MLKKCSLLLVFSMKNAKSYPENDPPLSVCPFKTPPCVRSKRLRVYRHHTHMLKHMCACECTHRGVLHLHTEVTHKTHAHRDTHRHSDTRTENTRHSGSNQDKNTDFSDKKYIFFDRKMPSAQGQPVDPRGRARPVRHGRTMWPENAFGASDGVIHSSIFILRVEPSSERKDILHIPQYQLDLRHLLSTAAVSTQNLDLPGFPPGSGISREWGSDRHEKSELGTHQIPGAG